jgi:hypothetical protein
MIRMIDESRRRPHDACHRLLRVGRWSLLSLWLIMARRVVARLAQGDPLRLDLDDTLFHRPGRKVNGAGNFRDAVRSSGKHVVYAHGLNIVVLTLRVRAAWGREPLGLPINMRLYKKGGPTHIDLAEQMIREVAGWFPGRRFVVCADGGYASLAGRLDGDRDRVHLVSRMRRDASIFAEPPRPKVRPRGRPRTKGQRLPTPERMATRAREGWVEAKTDFRGVVEDRLLLVRPVVWFRVRKRPVLLVVVRHPRGATPDDFFFTTDLEAVGFQVADGYAGRWSIEDTFRNVKQNLGGEDPQTWKHQGPERAAGLSLWLYTAVWDWYLEVHGAKQTWTTLPWYPQKRVASFADALAALRRSLLARAIF